MAGSTENTKRLIAGAMSGTSADGVDVAIVEITGRGLAMQATPIVHAYDPFTAELRRQILDVRQRGEVRLADLAEMGREVTLAYARAFRAALAKGNLSADLVEVIAAHGQTLYHGPPNTIQYFDPSLLAWETGVQVVSDFRRADLAAGGQGAPLVPFADWILFRHPTKSRVILNIGGIANITYLKAGGTIDEVVAFDTGPGNCISDWLAREHGLPGGIDKGGLLAKKGRANDSVARAFVWSDFVRMPPPKSTDGPAMIAEYARCEANGTRGRIEDRFATAAMTVAYAVRSALNLHIPQWEHAYPEILVGGGGVMNVRIMRELTEALQASRVGMATVSPLSSPFPRSTGERDQNESSSAAIDLAAAREAIAFALLGAATLDGEPANVPSATGASRRVVLGAITPRA